MPLQAPSANEGITVNPLNINVPVLIHKAFLRLAVSSHGILYAHLTKIKHNNEESLLIFFKKRFPSFQILLRSKRGLFTINNKNKIYVTNQSLKEGLTEFKEKLPKQPLLSNLKGKNYQKQRQNARTHSPSKGKSLLKKIR